MVFNMEISENPLQLECKIYSIFDQTFQGNFKLSHLCLQIHTWEVLATHYAQIETNSSTQLRVLSMCCSMKYIYLAALGASQYLLLCNITKTLTHRHGMRGLAWLSQI